MALDDDARRRAAETKRARTTTAIEEAAWKLLRDGAEDLTFNSVAKYANVSQATVYRYYPTMSELLKSAAQWGLTDEDAHGLCVQLGDSISAAMPTLMKVWRDMMEQALEDGADRSEIANFLLDQLLDRKRLRTVSTRGLHEIAYPDPEEDDDEPPSKRLPLVSKEGLEGLD